MTPYQQVMAALKQAGFIRGGKPLCPTCPPSKRRGFNVTEAKTKLGTPTVLLHCFRYCDMLEIVEAIGLDPADLYPAGARWHQEELFRGDRYCRTTVQGWKALPPSVARTFGIASAIGYYPSTRVGYTLLRSTGQWDAVRNESGIGRRALSLQVDKWIACDMAHRCEERGILALYRGPLNRCPNCGRATQEATLPTSQVQDTTRKYASKGTSASHSRHALLVTQPKERLLPIEGTSTSHPGEEEVS